MNRNNSNSAAILVLGDLNRSPRMLNHSASISQLLPDIKEVSLIGYDGGDLRADIKNDSIQAFGNIRFRLTTKCNLTLKDFELAK